MARLRWPAIGLVAVAVVLLLIGNSQVWFRSGPTTWTGADLGGGLVQALATVLLVLVLLLLVVRVTGRRIVGVAITLAGVGALLTGLLQTRPAESELIARAVTAGRPTGAAWLAVAAGVLAVIGGSLLVAGAAGWPQRRRKTGTASDHPIDLWKAQDQGLDPTSQETAD